MMLADLPRPSENQGPPSRGRAALLGPGVALPRSAMAGGEAFVPKYMLDLFGGPRLKGPEGVVTLSPYQRCALMVIASRPSVGVKRPHLAWLLWEEDPTPACRQRIRQLLHALRRRCRRDLFDDGPGGSIRLDPALVMTDLAIVEDHLRTGRLEEAAARVGRGFGADLGAPPTREFADWQDGVQVSMERRVREAAARAWDRARSDHDWSVARDAAEAAHRLAPDDEAVVRMVVEARGATGSLQGAESAFARFRDTLRPGTAPSPRTLELVDRVRSLQARVEAAEDEERLPLVGRDVALSALRDIVARVRDGRFEIAVVRGDAGAGKTRILDAAAREAGLAGVAPLVARAVEPERRIAMNTLLDALGHVDVAAHAQRMAEPWRSIVAGFLPPDAGVDHLPSIPPIQEGSVSRRLLDAFALLLASVAEEQPVLLCIDDLQWVDDTSLAVLRFAKRRWGEGRIGVVGTLRPDAELGRDAPAGALKDFLDVQTRTIELGELDGEDARTLIRLTAGRAVDDESAAHIEALGGRNPFYLVELTKDYLAGRIGPPTVPGETVPLPMSLQELFDRRFNRLDTVPRRVAEVLTVLARPLSVRRLAGLAGIPPDQCALAVDQLGSSRLVRIENGVVSLRHELFRSAIYRRVTPARAAVLHDRVAEHLLEQGAQTAPGEVAVHLAKSGRAEEAILFGRRAADDAVASGAVSEAAYFLELLVETETDDVGRAEATADLARLLHANREMARAAPFLSLAASRLRRVGRPGQAMRMAVRQVECRSELEGLPLSTSLQQLAGIKAEAREREDWEGLAIALDAELHLLHQAGEVSGIRSLFAEMRDCAGRGDVSAACLAHSSLALNILFGDPEEALASAREAVRLAEEEGQAQHLLMAQTRLVVVFYFRGMLNLPEGRSVITAARQSLAIAGHRGLRVMLEANVGAFLVDLGAPEEAEEVFERISKDFESVEARLPKFNYFVNRGESALARGDTDAAMSHLRRAEGLVDASIPSYMTNILNAQMGLCALAMGDLKSARAFSDALLPLDPDPYYDPTPVLALQAAALDRRQSRHEALAMIRTTSDRLRGRLELPWIKAKALEARIAQRMGKPQDDSVRDARLLAEQLNLVSLHRALAEYAPEAG